jgi:hypothetical protein
MSIPTATATQAPQAFAPKEEKPDAEPSSRATVIHLRKIGLQHGWVHGQPKDAPLVDTDLDRLDVSLIVGGDRTVADLSTLEVTARSLPQGVGLRTHVEAHYAKPPERGDQVGRADLKGEISGVPFSLHGSIDGPEIVGNLDVPRVTPDDARRMAPTLALTQELTAHAEVRGRLPELHANVHVGLGQGAVDIDARASVAEEKEVHATISANQIDAHAVSRTAPTTHLGVDATIDAAMSANGKGKGSYVLDVPAGDFGGNLVPAMHLEGKMTMSPAAGGVTEIAVDGKGDIDEPGARTKVQFDLRQRGDASAIDFHVSTPAARLDRTRFGHSISGSAALDVRGTFTWAARWWWMRRSISAPRAWSAARLRVDRGTRAPKSPGISTSPSWRRSTSICGAAA